jgi:phage-related protein
MRWKSKQYGRVWQETYDACDEDTRDTLDYRLDLLEEYGNLSGRPISAHLEDGIFELRAKDARMLFYFSEWREIVFVHCIIKKTRKVPREDIESAKKNRTEHRKNEARRNAISSQNKPRRET